MAEPSTEHSLGLQYTDAYLVFKSFMLSPQWKENMKALTMNLPSLLAAVTLIKTQLSALLDNQTQILPISYFWLAQTLLSWFMGFFFFFFWSKKAAALQQLNENLPEPNIPSFLCEP